MTIHEILKVYWGYDQFRPLQEEIIHSVLSGNDTLALMPTGGGKSLCFQVPALMKEGLCLVVSPLIALMKDQVENLKKREIPAVAVYSGMSRRDIDITLDNCVYGNIKFLYLSPERLHTEIFIERAKRMKINLIAVDEAHCISQWGYDFRPAYLQLAILRELLPAVPVLALTATATPEVQHDIQEKLAFRQPLVFKKSFARANLSYSVLPEENKEQKLLQILQAIPGAAVVYVRSRKRSQELARFLSQHHISATFYHAGLDYKQRAERQDNWLDNKIRVIVATNAFGMGIDKPDVRVVIHTDLPDNLEAYYQEAGRAGRDEGKAYAVLLALPSETTDLQHRLTQQYPEYDFLKKTYQALANFFQVAVGGDEMASYDFDLELFQDQYNLPAYATYFALKRLEDAGLIQFNESFFQPSRLHFRLSGQDIYRYRVANTRFDTFLQVLLRLYGGELYSGFMNISEEDIARKSHLSLTDTQHNLEYLHQNGIVYYQPQKEKPQLTFLTPRHDLQRLPLNTAYLEARKQTAQRRLLAMTSYATSHNRCRTLLFQDYFGEQTDATCGVCDVCVKQRRQLMQTKRYQQYRLHILTLLQSQPADLQQLFDAIPQAKRDEFVEVVKALTGSGEIEYDASGKVRLT